MMQNKNQQNLTSPPPVIEDDFSIPELTVKDGSGTSQKVTLTAAPAPAPKNDESDDKDAKLAEFREKASSLTGITADTTEASVLADLEARAKQEEEKELDLEAPKPIPTEVSKESPIKIPEPVAIDQSEEDDDDDDIFISLDDFREEIEKYKEEKGSKDNQTNPEVTENDDEPVLANPMKPIAPIAVPAAPVKADDDLIPEIDLDAEDIFDEAKNAGASENPSDQLSTVDVKSKQELSRGETKRKAVVQNIMKTETIFDRNKKPERAKKAFAANDQDAFKTLTPVEELEVLSLDEWRRLGDIPEERMAKIKEKIELLGEKGILSQIKGLNSWRRSPVMQQYLDLGIQALLDKKGVEEYMENVDEDTSLNYQEWIAINKLNSQLMI